MDKENLKNVELIFILRMNSLRLFLRVLQERYNSPFLVEGNIRSTNDTIGELAEADPFYSVKFSLKVVEPAQVCHLINDWAPRAHADIKHIYWRDLDNLITIYHQMKIIEVTTNSNAFLNICADHANNMQYEIRRI